MTSPAAPPVVVILDRPEGSADLDVSAALGDAELIDIVDVPQAERAGVLRRARAVVVDLEPVDASLIAQLSSCELIAEFGVGVDNIDVAAATAAGITVVSVPDYCVEELADHTLALVLTLTRGIHLYSAATSSGSWDYRSAGPLHRSSSLTVGVVGYGRVGRAVKARLDAVGFRTVVTDPFQPGATDATGNALLSLSELVATADVVTLHCPLTDASRHLIGRRELNSMKASAFLVNTARGGLVDQSALYDVLREGGLAGAGLDVLAEEPPAMTDPLLRLPNVAVTPHAGFYSEESLHALHVSVFNEVGRLLRGQPPRHPVNSPASPEGQ